jgi:hypothetical protein
MIKLSRFYRSLPAVALSLLAAASLQAQNYNEIGDAGSSFGTGQATGGTSGQTLTSISGLLGNLSDGDFYFITIGSPVTFSATTVNGSTSVDTMLYLFDMFGNAVFLNDDAASGTSLQSTLPAGSMFGPLAPGTYILGISLTGVDPINLFNQRMFANGNFSTDVRGPAIGAPGPVGGVSNSGLATQAGTYLITLTGAQTSAVPEPGVVALFGLGAVGTLVLLRRRRPRA